MINESWEIISLKIKLNKTYNNFIFAYKPPSKNDVELMENLETVMFYMNLIHELFIIEDLNMNSLYEKANKLREFCIKKSLVNYVIQPTRVQLKKNNRLSSTLIDVILHNGNKVSKKSIEDFA